MKIWTHSRGRTFRAFRQYTQSMVVLASFLAFETEPIAIAIQPLGTVKSSLVRAVKVRLEGVYKSHVTILDTKPLPKSAFYPPRSRYRADRLLPMLAQAKKFDKIIGIASLDISTTKPPYKDWGVFGLGSMPGKSCVVSDFRLHKKGSVSQVERLCRVAVHEIGHTLGLDHCPTPHCTMSDAEGALKTVDEETGFCRLCRRRAPQIR